MTTTTTDLTAGTMEIHVYYLGCGHVKWLCNPVNPVPAEFRCQGCDYRLRLVIGWEARQVLEGPGWPRPAHTGRVATCQDCRGPIDGFGLTDCRPWAPSPDGLGLTCPTCKSTVPPF